MCARVLPSIRQPSTDQHPAHCPRTEKWAVAFKLWKPHTTPRIRGASSLAIVEPADGRVRPYATLAGMRALGSGRWQDATRLSVRTLTNVLTTRASNCDPEQRCSSSMAASKVIAVR